jgi:hypothetical protein
MGINRKHSLLLGLVGCLSTVAGAQSLQSQVLCSAGVGYLSGVQVVNYIGKTTGGDRHANIETGATPNYFMSCSYFVRPRLALGIAMGLQSLTGHSNTDWTNRMGVTPYAYQQDYITLAAELVHVHRQSRNFQLYSTYGLALSYAKTRYNYPASTFDRLSPKTSFYPNLQYSPLGLRVGRALSGFLEVGVGYKGFINAGISYRISTKEDGEENEKVVE